MSLTAYCGMIGDLKVRETRLGMHYYGPDLILLSRPF